MKGTPTAAISRLDKLFFFQATNKVVFEKINKINWTNFSLTKPEEAVRR